LRPAIMLRPSLTAFTSLMPLVNAQRTRRKLESCVLTTLIFAGFCGVAHADVYRWVDDHGEPHYSDRWVPGSELIKSSKPRPSVETPAAAQTQTRSPVPSANQTEATKQEKANETAVKQDVAKTKEAQCKQAKDRYQKAIEARRIYKPGKDGEERVYMSDEESDKYRLDARNDVTLTCGSPPPPVRPE
jgi:Domain of unknown function (DUF4124)